MIGSNYKVEGKLRRWKLKKPYDCMAICSVSGTWLPLPDELRNFEINSGEMCTAAQLSFLYSNVH